MATTSTPTSNLTTPGSTTGTTTGTSQVTVTGTPSVTPAGTSAETLLPTQTGVSGVPTDVSGAASSDLFSALTGLIPTGIGMFDAQQMQQQYQQYANTLANLGQPYVAAGQQQLGLGQTGQLTPAQQAQIATLTGQAGTLTGQANPLISGGENAIQLAQSGQLPAWQQQQVDNQTAAQIAQLKSSLGPNVDSSALANAIGAIQQQAAITKGNVAQQNLAAGESEYNLGATTQTQAMQAQQAAANAPLVDAQTAFSNALNLAAGGNQPVESAVNTLIQGDQLVAQQFQALMQSLASSGVLGSSITGIGNLLGGAGSAIANLFGGLTGSSGAGNTLPGGMTNPQNIAGSSGAAGEEIPT